MKPALGTLLALAGQFGGLSLLAFGGANAVVPEMHRQAVEAHHWLDDRTFSSLFAIAQAAPGPNFLISTLIGWKAAGLAGALVATVAMMLPSCILTFWVARIWDHHRAARWRLALAGGLAPVTVGLVMASAWLLARAADSNLRLTAITMATATAAYFTRLNPLWWLAAAAALGIVGIAGG
jgi:chromate transporter